MFGRNEAGGQRFHGWVDKLINAETNVQVAALLNAAEPESQQ
jgi:hypothetical protein